MTKSSYVTVMEAIMSACDTFLAFFTVVTEQWTTAG